MYEELKKIVLNIRISIMLICVPFIITRLILTYKDKQYADTLLIFDFILGIILSLLLIISSFMKGMKVLYFYAPIIFLYIPNFIFPFFEYNNTLFEDYKTINYYMFITSSILIFLFNFTLFASMDWFNKCQKNKNLKENN